MRAEVPHLSDASVRAIGEHIYTLAEEATGELVELREKGVEVDLREGSLEIVTIVVTTVGVLYSHRA